MTTARLRPLTKVAALSFIVAALGAWWSLRRALVLDPMPPPFPATSGAGARTIEPRPPLPAAKLAAAVDKDPFHPERRRPKDRFRFPGEGSPAQSGAEPAPATSFKLIGTALLPEGRGFVMCQRGTDPPKLVRIGERLGDLTLKVVDRGRAVFLSPSGARIEVRVQAAGI